MTHMPSLRRFHLWSHSPHLQPLPHLIHSRFRDCKGYDVLFPFPFLKTILNIYLTTHGSLRHTPAMRGSQCRTRCLCLLPPHMYVFDSSFDFIVMMILTHSVQSQDSDAIMELSTQPSIVGLPESGKSSEHGVVRDKHSQMNTHLSMHS
jgi:hypothetical protein